MNEPRERKVASDASRLAWVLAGVGLAAGALQLGLFERALNRVQALRSQITAATAVSQRMLGAFDADLRAVDEHMSALLSRSDGTDTRCAGMDRFRSELRLAPLEPNAQNITTLCRRLADPVEQIEQLESRIAKFEASDRALRKQAILASVQVDAAFHDLQAAADTAQGLARLERLAAARRDKASSHVDVPNADRETDVPTIRMQMADLAILQGALMQERDPDRFVDLKDNRFASALRRLHELLERHAQGAPAADTLRPGLIAAVEESLFGAGYSFDAEHQSISLGRGGLFDLRRRLVADDHKRDALAAEADAQVIALRDIRLTAGESVTALVNEIRARVQAQLMAQRTNMVIIGIASAAVFLALAMRIAVSVKRLVSRVEIANGELGIARDVAESASRAKGEFLANMSHEIRTPMSAILGYAELMLDPKQPVAERIDGVTTIRRNGEHLLSIINDILDLSKIEAGKMTVESIECSPAQIVNEVLSLMQVRVKNKSVHLSADCDNGLPALVMTDPVRLRQVLVNLVGNALKFTDSGDVEVICRGEAGGEHSHRLTFEVRDSGIGMTPEQLKRLFSAFSQADCSTTRKYGGTGLGLTISKRLAHLLGGDLTVTSRSGQGSSFTLTIQAGEVESGHAAASQRQRLPLLAPNEKSLAGARILLAEDGPDIQRLITRHLEDAGAIVEVAENGRIAVSKALAAGARGVGTGFELILMDMQMPELDGYGAASLLRQEGCRVPIIAVTAHAMPEDRPRCISAGCDDYLSKPADRDALVRICRDWMTKSSQVRKAA